MAGSCVAGGIHDRGCVTGRGECVAGGMHGTGGGHVWQGVCMAGETATAAGDTHPTGTHSCLKKWNSLTKLL